MSCDLFNDVVDFAMLAAPFRERLPENLGLAAESGCRQPIRDGVKLRRQ
jgi:hypothetical protein